MARPAGVTIIAILCFLVAAFFLLIEIRLFARTDVIRSFSTADSDSGFVELAAVIILDLIIIFPILYALAGWGLWRLKNWGRIMIIALLLNGSVFSLLRLLLTSHLNTSRVLSTVASFAVYGVIISYLLKADVKAAFSSFNPAAQVHKPSVHFIP